MTRIAGRDEGFALITALWAALLLGLLASYVVMASRTDARTTRTTAIQAQQRAVASGMIALTELRLLGPQAGQLRLDGTPSDVTYAGYRGRVRLQDQDGLIDLNFAGADTLSRTLQILGQLDTNAANTMVDRIQDWREQGAGRRINGAKAPEYQAAGYAYGPRERGFESVLEFKLVLGVSELLFDRLAPALTVYSQKPLIDRSVAPLAVLPILPGMTPELVEYTVRQRANALSNSPPPGGLAGLVVAIDVELTSCRGCALFKAATTLRLTGIQDTPDWIYETHN